MREYILILSFVAFLGILPVYSTPVETCAPTRNASYTIADKEQCDKYYLCTKSGKLLDRLCDDGFVYSLEISQCDYPHNVNCSERPILQPTTSIHPNCPRSNGFYPFPASISCQQFYHCLEGQAYEKTCPEGVIFDPSKGSCIHPDMSRRPDCAAKEVLNFICPNSLNRFAKLRFGDHDRHSHPEDCRKFFICLKSGKPRVGSCPGGTVFNGATGYCDTPKNVKGCTDYYGTKDIQKLLEDSDSEFFDFDGDSTNNDFPAHHKKKTTTTDKSTAENEVESPEKTIEVKTKKFFKRHSPQRSQNFNQFGPQPQQHYLNNQHQRNFQNPQQGFNGPYNNEFQNQRRYRKTDDDNDDDKDDKDDKDEDKEVEKHNHDELRGVQRDDHSHKQSDSDDKDEDVFNDEV